MLPTLVHQFGPRAIDSGLCWRNVPQIAEGPFQFVFIPDVILIAEGKIIRLETRISSEGHKIRRKTLARALANGNHVGIRICEARN